MTLPTLEAVVKLAEALPSMTDRRPPWLTALHEATDPKSLYYRLFFELASFYAPLTVVEIGTYVGTSAAHLAAANRGGSVVTIDHNPDAARQVEKNIPAAECGVVVVAVTDDSLAFARSGRLAERTTDLLFIDGNHTWAQAYDEYLRYRPTVKDGGLIFFDDIRLDMATRDMEVLWAMIPDPKVDLSALHHTGFGVAKVDRSVVPLPWDVAAREARKKGLRRA